MKKKIILFGGGTFSHVRNHLALAAPAFGGTVKELTSIINRTQSFDNPELNVVKVLTKMADPLGIFSGGQSEWVETQSIVTNADVVQAIDTWVADPDVKIIFFSGALVDYDGAVGYVESGSHAQRLKTSEGNKLMTLFPSEKLVGRIRKERKDIFLVAFKTTTGYTEQEQYIAGLNLLKENSCNLVLANDTVTRLNMIIVPEEARYSVTHDRQAALKELWDITSRRSKLTYTKSVVVPATSVSWNDPEIPPALRAVVNYCIEKGAYKPFRGSTSGHFAVRVDNDTFITSKRKTNFNDLSKVGMVKVVSTGKDSVIAYGAKPSVGGQSQRIVFAEHPGYDCIVHFHCPPKPEYAMMPWRSQRNFQCGSHECGKNTSDGLDLVQTGIKAVYLENHGPNIVFKSTTSASTVIEFIEKHFDLSQKTGGPVDMSAPLKLPVVDHNYIEMA